MKAGDLIRVLPRRDGFAGQRDRLGVIISFVGFEEWPGGPGPGCHIMLINGAKKWFPTKRLQVINESR